MPDDIMTETNCDGGFGKYMTAEQHAFGNVCNGGYYDGVLFSACASREACMRMKAKPIVPLTDVLAKSPGTTTPQMARTRSSQSPVFLPSDKADALSRLGRNILQGVLNAFGWHILSYTERVDLFPDKKK